MIQSRVTKSSNKKYKNKVDNAYKNNVMFNSHLKVF